MFFSSSSIILTFFVVLDVDLTAPPDVDVDDDEFTPFELDMLPFGLLDDDDDDDEDDADDDEE